MTSSIKAGDKVCYKDGSAMKGPNFEGIPYKVVNWVYQTSEDERVEYVGGGWDYADDLMIFKKPVEDTSKHHKHHDLIIAWAKGALIEYEGPTGNWYPIDKPSWSSTTNYRIASTEVRQALELRQEIEKLQKELAKLEGDL